MKLRSVLQSKRGYAASQPMDETDVHCVCGYIMVEDKG